MSTENVTPIGGGNSRKERGECSRFHLAQPDDGPDNMRLIQALRGVCGAIEALAQDDIGMSLELGTAASILSDMLRDRISDALDSTG